MKVAIILGLLIGLAVGAGVCAKYLRQEVAANLGPRLQRIEQQLDALRAEINLATEIRLASLSRRIDPDHPST